MYGTGTGETEETKRSVGNGAWENAVGSRCETNHATITRTEEKNKGEDSSERVVAQRARSNPLVACRANRVIAVLSGHKVAVVPSFPRFRGRSAFSFPISRSSGRFFRRKGEKWKRSRDAIPVLAILARFFVPVDESPGRMVWRKIAGDAGFVRKGVAELRRLPRRVG